MSAELAAADRLFQPAVARGGELVCCITDAEVVDKMPRSVAYSRASMTGRSFAQHLFVEEDNDVGDAHTLAPAKAIVVLHGVTALGESVTLFVDGFSPSVSFVVGDNCSKEHLLQCLDRIGLRSARSTPLSVQHGLRRTWGYDLPQQPGERFRGRTVFTFALRSVRELRFWRKVCRAKPEGLAQRDAARFVELVEGSIDPLVQFYAQTKLAPGGWLRCHAAHMADMKAGKVDRKGRKTK